jgi:hypothetical protein
MKFTFFLMAMLSVQIASAQSLREKRIKAEMLEKVDQLIEKVEETRHDLEQEDVSAACDKIHQIKELYPDHLKTSAKRLDLERRRTSKVKDRALNELIFFHQQSVECKKGRGSEFVDPSELDKELKRISKSLKKQRKIIEKNDTDHNNSFSYRYRFQS